MTRSPATRHIVIYGTSLSAEHSPFFWRRCGGYWVTMLRQSVCQRHPGETLLTNASRWGAHSRWALKHMRSRVSIHEPHVLLLEFAINDADMRNRISVTESEKNIESMIGLALDSNASCDIWVLTSHIPRGRHVSVRPALADYYAMYESVAERNDVGLIDLHRKWGGTAPDRKYIPDGIHTNELAARDVILPGVLAHLDL
ncbi:MAG: SGNH/GDSL hydrolase family protein [Gammaproteobacteria bacterium]|nr:SGNH/GDSL hydrolase family protein [Gammaproteobacteria bacterium]NNL51713.1 SGNH/GDSL hydrolase family protein [Woeseiaceae bacterium]